MGSVTTDLSERLKAEAVRLGFDACGISVATALDYESDQLADWLGAGNHGTMGWMENHRSKRIDPRELVPGARSVVSVLQNYYQPVTLSADPEHGRISRYALGDDYHLVMKDRLRALMAWLEMEVGEVNGRVFVDSAPVMEKAWAARAGLGWQGKHSNLINTQIGSWFFIGEMIVDTELHPDSPVADMCGTCTRCIEACPTDAITGPYVVDGSRCISYLTIEHRADDIEPTLAARTGNWIFGCDICQDVCPWNKFQSPAKEAAYAPIEGVLSTRLDEWSTLTELSFKEQFRKSPVKRAKWVGFLRNVRIALENACRLNAPSDSDIRSEA